MKTMENNKCKNCANARPSYNETAVMCKLLNSCHNKCECCGKNKLTFAEVKGKVYKGWYKNGIMMVSGYLVDNDATCEHFEVKE